MASTLLKPLSYIIWASLTIVILFTGAVVGIIGVVLDNSEDDLKNNSPSLVMFLLSALLSIIAMFSVCSMCLQLYAIKKKEIILPHSDEIGEML